MEKFEIVMSALIDIGQRHAVKILVVVGVLIAASVIFG